MRVRSVCPPLVVVVVLFGSGCASLRPQVSTRYPPCACDPSSALVLVAEGAGDFHVTSNNLQQVSREANVPLCVQRFSWSHGYLRVLADQIDYANQCVQGRRLAALILAYRQQQPGRPVHLVAHSAGSGVVLIAAENLPPDTVERVVLLSPAVSAYHDLRPALRAARQGVDVFYSTADWWTLGVGTAVLGTTDRQWDPAAGRVGFRPANICPQDAPLYDKLRQYPWDESLAWTGNLGGHYGAYQPDS